MSALLALASLASVNAVEPQPVKPVRKKSLNSVLGNERIKSSHLIT